jgi:hypothetical protein
VIECWRKLHNEERHNYNWNNQVKGDEMSRVCSIHGEKINAQTILMAEPKGKRPHGTKRWENNIKNKSY